jgi:hypothetical protein
MAVFMREGTNSPELMFIVGPHTINPYLGRVPEGVTASCQAMRTWTLGNVQDPQFVELSALQCIVWVATHQHLGFYDIALYDGHAKSPALTQGGHTGHYRIVSSEEWLCLLPIYGHDCGSLRAAVRRWVSFQSFPCQANAIRNEIHAQPLESRPLQRSSTQLRLS